MDKFTTLTGVAAPLPIVNVDTDMIIPKDYLKTIKRTGLGAGLFAEMRFNEDGSENPDFVLNKAAWRKAQILVAGDNFGCGSSREHAPWALEQFGFRALIAPSYGGIFYNNCWRNGIVPVELPIESVRQIADEVEAGKGAKAVTVDLESKTVTSPGGTTFSFQAPDTLRQMLLLGQDEIALTLSRGTELQAFRQRDRAERPWAY